LRKSRSETQKTNTVAVEDLMTASDKLLSDAIAWQVCPSGDMSIAIHFDTRGKGLQLKYRKE
jgi:hypothetical protein